MLILTVDFVPAGIQARRRTIASMHIGNVSGLSDVSDYEVNVMEGANPLSGTPARLASFEVRDHDRQQSVWALIAKAASASLTAEYDEM
jgi:hypothetical protein